MEFDLLDTRRGKQEKQPTLQNLTGLLKDIEGQIKPGNTDNKEVRNKVEEIVERAFITLRNAGLKDVMDSNQEQLSKLNTALVNSLCSELRPFFQRALVGIAGTDGSLAKKLIGKDKKQQEKILKSLSSKGDMFELKKEENIYDAMIRDVIHIFNQLSLNPFYEFKYSGNKTNYGEKLEYARTEADTLYRPMFTANICALVGVLAPMAEINIETVKAKIQENNKTTREENTKNDSYTKTGAFSRRGGRTLLQKSIESMPKEEEKELFKPLSSVEKFGSITARPRMPSVFSAPNIFAASDQATELQQPQQEVTTSTEQKLQRADGFKNLRNSKQYQDYQASSSQDQTKELQQPQQWIGATPTSIQRTVKFQDLHKSKQYKEYEKLSQSSQSNPEYFSRDK